MPLKHDHPVQWAISDSLVPYEAAEALMKARAEAIAAGEAEELVWLLEHPPLYTAGTSAVDADLLESGRFPVYKTGRGGQFTYHGPGQRVVYLMLNLKKRKPDIHAFVHGLEQWLIASLARFNVTGVVHADRVGVWVPHDQGDGENKIAAIGIRVRKWVTFHGIALNVDPELEHFSGIVPCGIREHGVTSLADLGQLISMAEVDMALRAEFENIFGPTVQTAPPDMPLA